LGEVLRLRNRSLRMLPIPMNQENRLRTPTKLGDD
jgi:hypothetical protein